MKNFNLILDPNSLNILLTAFLMKSQLTPSLSHIDVMSVPHQLNHVKHNMQIEVQSQEFLAQTVKLLQTTDFLN